MDKKSIDTPEVTSASASESAGLIVIVDDNLQNLQMLKAILEDKGYEIRAAISGKLALDAINQVRPDLILLDIMMPEMSGYEVCEYLKSNEETKDIPVLFISALDDPEDKMRAFEAGGLDYIPKPFHIEEVIMRVQTHISLRKTKQELDIAYLNLKDHADKLEAANNELRSFSYSVSHDLRAPLRSISGFSQILSQDYGNIIDKEGQDYLKRINQSVNRMGVLIENMLQLSQLSNAEMIRHKVNFKEIAETVISELREQDPEREVSVTIATDMPSFCDGGLMEIALENLLGNAWKYTLKSENPTIEFGVNEKDGEHIYFVKDNGAGFDMKHADRIFEPFRRLHSTNDFEGSGIGLATVQRIIYLHGGRVWVDSKRERGTTFYFVVE